MSDIQDQILASAQAFLANLEKQAEQKTAPTRTKVSLEDIVDSILPMVPDELKRQNRWLTWSGDPKNKQPFISGTSNPASTNNPEHLVSFETAAKNLYENKGYKHLGFVPKHPYFGIDLDSCRDPQTGLVQPWAIGLLELIGSTYVEITPSLSGLRPWVTIPHLEQKKVTFKIKPELGTTAKNPQVELLAQNYGTITGEPYHGSQSIVGVLTEERWTKIVEYLRSLAPEQETKTSSSGSDRPYVQTIKAQDGDIKELLAGLPDVQEGDRDNYLASVAGNLRQGSKLHEPWSKENGLVGLQAVDEQKCKPPLGQHACERITNSIWKNPIKDNTPIPAKIGGYAQVVESSAQAKADQAVEASQDAEGTFPFGEAIPDFDDTVITGSFRKLVDAICNGTTIPRQYGLHAAKALACSILTQHKVQFEDCESARAYFIVFGDTGTGKGLTFRRLQKIVDISQNQELFVKIIHAVDSEAGLRDAFFEIPTNKNIPILFFVDEIKTLGHKADGKKNPEIADAIVELANNPTVSRTKSKKTVAGAASKTRSDSWLLLYACAQDGEAYGMAFPRTKAQGLPDRFIPEYSPKIVPGRLPEPDMNLGIEAIAEMHRNAFKNQKMVMAADVKTKLDEIWSGQPEDFQKSPRLRQQFILELYLAAFSRGSAVAELQDVGIAVKALERQKPIRTKFFMEEIPNQVGVYSNRLKAVHREMMRRLRRGVGIGDVALSLRDIMTRTLAYKENDLPNFNQAWKAQGPFWIEIPVKTKNGHTYQKFVPTPEETDTWLPVDLVGGMIG
jgi:hypothetical protein